MKLIFSLCLFLLSLSSSRAQPPVSDLDLLGNTPRPVAVKDSLNDKKLMDTRSKNTLASYNPVIITAKGAMFFYQRVVSPQLAAACVYQRSCSNFSKKAIQTYGLVKGVFLSADRLMRCNEYCVEEHPGFDTKVNDEPSLYRIK